MDSTRSLLEDICASDEIRDFDSFRESFHTSVRLEHAHGASEEELFSSALGMLSDDIPARIEAGARARVSMIGCQ